MNEFGKWYDEYSYWAEIDEEGLPLQISKDTWDAALRWVLSIDDGFCNCGAMNVDEHSSTYEKIENELKNLK